MEGIKMLKVPPDWSEGYDYFKVTLNLNGKECFGTYAIKEGEPYQKALHEDACANVEEMIRAYNEKRIKAERLIAPLEALVKHLRR